jgi:hypothetical protein
MKTAGDDLFPYAIQKSLIIALTSMQLPIPHFDAVSRATRKDGISLDPPEAVMPEPALKKAFHSTCRVSFNNKI